MSDRVEHITIVGGGTAGWLTAMIINTFVNTFREGPAVKVTLIESPKIPTVGVGEATVAGMPMLMQQLGIDEAELFRRCNASFKVSVRFGDWSVDDHGKPFAFYHPFNFPNSLGGYSPAYHFNRFGPYGANPSITDNVTANSALIHARKGPRALNGENYEKSIGYAYHLDAGLFGEFMRDVAKSRGVEHIRDDVIEIFQDEAGAISGLQLEQGGHRPVEFVIDCTGFKSMIMKEVLKEPFISYSDYLLNDRAIPVQLPHRDPTKIEPCTRSTALGAGWVWRVPLYSRVGTGYVFSSAFRSDDEARDEFFKHLRSVGDLPSSAPDPDVRVIKMRIGHTQRFWVKNCVAIGLSNGFLEPLEATAIYTVEMAARWLVGHFPDKKGSPALSKRYNQLMTSLYQEVREFVSAHYHSSNRPDPFWKAAREDCRLPESLRDKLELWKTRLPETFDTQDYQLFNYWNFMYVLHPKGYFKDCHFPLEGSIRHEHWEAFGRRLEDRKAELLRTMPDHYQLLANIRGDTPIQPTFDLEGVSKPAFESRASVRPTIPLPTA